MTKSLQEWLHEGEALYESALAEYQALEGQLDELEARLAAKREEVNQIAQVVGKPPVEPTRRLAATGLFKLRIKRGREVLSPRAVTAELGLGAIAGEAPREVLEWERVNELLQSQGILFHQLTQEETQSREKTKRILGTFQGGMTQKHHRYKWAD